MLVVVQPKTQTPLRIICFAYTYKETAQVERSSYYKHTEHPKNTVQVECSCCSALMLPRYIILFSYSTILICGVVMLCDRLLSFGDTQTHTHATYSSTSN